MPTQRDFPFEIDHAASLTLDATCAARAAGSRALPQPHRNLLTTAIRSLERAQLIFFELRQGDPWAHKPPKPRQLELL